MPRIIDAHLHCSELPGDELVRYARFNGLNYTLRELLELMEGNGVERGLLLSPPVEGWSAAPNSRIVDLCSKSNDKLFPILTVEPSKDQVESVIELARKNEGYAKGFKIRLGYVRVYPDDPVFESLYDYAEQKNLPVMFHTGDTADSNGSLMHAHPLALDRLANRRENLKIVACHFGNPWFVDVGELIYKHPNVYTDISGLVAGDGGRYSEKYVESIATKISDSIYFAGGAEKVIFGTDYPVETFEGGLDLVSRLAIDEEDKEKILSRNAARLFFS